ncbi:MAG: ribosomal protein S18-alanine N-acetyltransferase [Desulfurococcales archaeon]|nr:ribosomal protein S18-alanine N-acetyltransferase [Desulfurococcales archaeon]MEB3788824.1 ribosomal protein S18-alanine N-acetyltransferase [Desulfurococcales archaeon]
MVISEPLKARDNKTGFIIRKAKVEDLPSVMLVNMRSLPENYWYGFFLSILNEWRESFFVAEIDNTIVGYSMSRVEYTVDPVLLGVYNELEEGSVGIIDKMKHILSAPTRVGHLISIAVLEEYRGRGIGSALLQHTIDAMRNVYKVASIYLEVRVSNIGAIRLYEKFGFKKARIVREYYRDGEDAYVMVLKL